MKRNIPKVCASVESLLQQDKDGGDALHSISIGSVDWFMWLEQQSSFSFESLYGSLTARKEQRHDNWYWYAYRRTHKKLHTVYLGKTEELTLERLHEVAQTLTSIGIQVGSTSHETVQGEHFHQISLDAFPLYTKLSIPSLPSNFVARPHLTQRLSEGVSQKLVLVSAPPGSGKTTLLSDWIHQSRYPVAWVSLDELDNDLVHFWSYIVWALQTVHTSIGEKVLELLRSLELRSIESVLTLLINTFMAISSDFALALDDYHVINTPLIHQTLSFLINHLPPHIHLIIVSRSDPPLPFARLRAHGDLVELRTSDLHFLPHEIRTFLTQTMRLNLSEELVSALETHTEGWIAGLQLAALSLQSHKDHRHHIEVFKESHRYIMDYLVEEVLYRQNQGTQTFLLYTSILERLSGPLCDAVTDQNDSRAYLEQLERSNLFLVPLDKQQCWYRYHHLFNEILRSRLRDLQPDMLPELNMRAYTWCKHNGLTSEAINYAVAAGAFEQAAQLIIQVGEETIKHCEVMILQMWLDKLPDELVHSHPQLGLLRVWTLMILGQLETADLWLEEIERRLKRNSGEPVVLTKHLTGLSSSDEKDVVLQNILGEVAALRAHVTAMWGDIPATLAHAQQALEHLPMDSLHLRGLSALNLGIAYWLQDDVIAAEQAFTQACELAQAAESSYVALTATCALAQMQMMLGQRRLAIKTSRRALKMASEGHGKFLPAAAYAYVVMGQHFYEWNDLATATRYLQEGLALSEQWKNEDMFVYGCTELAQVKQAQGDTEGAAELLLRAEQYVQSHQAQSWIVNAMIAQQTRLALAQGDIERAKSLMQRAEYGYLSIFKLMLSARIHIAQGQFARALAIVKQQIPRAQFRGQKGLVIELHVLESMTYQWQHDTAAALPALERALSLAEPEGYIRLFANEGAPMAALLSQALIAQQQRNGTSSNQVSQEYIKKLLMALGKPVGGEVIHASESSLSATRQPPIESFSEREWEIVQLIATGISNQEIARQLIIAETTVKWHIRNIFSKLNVRSRSQIIARAHELQWCS